jgi:hypothetical protein
MSASNKHAILAGLLAYIWFHIVVAVLDIAIGEFVCGGILAAFTLAIIWVRNYLKVHL